MKRILIILGMGFCMMLECHAQNNNRLESEFDEWRHAIHEDFENFRRQCNEEYAEFLENTWRQFHGLLPKVSPIKDKPIPPMPYEEGEGGIKDKELPYVDIVPIAPPTPQPKPVEPIKEQPQPVEERLPSHSFVPEDK